MCLVCALVSRVCPYPHPRLSLLFSDALCDVDAHMTVEELLLFVNRQCELTLERWMGNEVVEHAVFALYESFGL